MARVEAVPTTAMRENGRAAGDATLRRLYTPLAAKPRGGALVSIPPRMSDQDTQTRRRQLVTR